MIILIIVQGLVERSHHSVTARSASGYPDVDQRWTVYGIGILIVSKFQSYLHEITIIIIIIIITTTYPHKGRAPG